MQGTMTSRILFDQEPKSDPSNIDSFQSCPFQEITARDYSEWCDSFWQNYSTANLQGRERSNYEMDRQFKNEYENETGATSSEYTLDRNVFRQLKSIPLNTVNANENFGDADRAMRVSDPLVGPGEAVRAFLFDIEMKVEGSNKEQQDGSNWWDPTPLPENYRHDCHHQNVENSRQPRVDSPVGDSQAPRLLRSDTVSVSTDVPEEDGYSCTRSESNQDDKEISFPEETPDGEYCSDSSTSLCKNSSDQNYFKRNSAASCMEVSSTPKPEESSLNIRPFQSKKWMCQYKALLYYREQHGNCNVPFQTTFHNRKEQQLQQKLIPLSKWVKRQRHQYKLRASGKHSHLTDERVQLLEDIGFIWDSHDAAWEENYEGLRKFYQQNGHCHVPVVEPRLSTWMKRQRRQYKLFITGKTSTMTNARIDKLNELEFVWSGSSIHCNSTPSPSGQSSCT